MTVQIGLPNALQTVDASAIQVTPSEVRVTIKTPLGTMIALGSAVDVQYDPGTGTLSTMTGTLTDYNFSVNEQQILAVPGTVPSAANPLTTKVISSGWITIKLA